MKLLAILLSLTVVESIGGELNDFRWKQRILVVTSSSLSLRVNLVKDEVGLLERDVRVFILDDPEKAPSSSLAAELKQRLKTLVFQLTLNLNCSMMIHQFLGMWITLFNGRVMRLLLRLRQQTMRYLNTVSVQINQRWAM